MRGNIYKFNPESSCTEEMVKQSSQYKLMEKLERGDRVTADDLVPFDELWHPDAYRTGHVRTGGWLLDFTPYFKRFLVNIRYYGWVEVRAYNKTTVRKLSAEPSRILEIVEVAA